MRLIIKSDKRRWLKIFVKIPKQFFLNEIQLTVNDLGGSCIYLNNYPQNTTLVVLTSHFDFTLLTYPHTLGSYLLGFKPSSLQLHTHQCSFPLTWRDMEHSCHHGLSETSVCKVEHLGFLADTLCKTWKSGLSDVKVIALLIGFLRCTQADVVTLKHILREQIKSEQSMK